LSAGEFYTVLSEMVVAVHCTCAEWFCRRSPKRFWLLLPRLAKVTASRGMSGKLKIFCIFVMTKVTARRGMSGKQIFLCIFVMTKALMYNSILIFGQLVQHATSALSQRGVHKASGVCRAVTRSAALWWITPNSIGQTAYSDRQSS